MDQRFDKPVRVALKIGTTYVIDRPLRAAEALLNEWPTEGGTKHLAARKAVLKALEHAHDAMLVAKARKAFEAACAEADILRDPPPRPNLGNTPPPRWQKKRKLKRDM